MENRNQWEYDYASLYQGQNAGQPSGGTGYVNVGSSGTNTANQYNTTEPQAATPGAGQVQFTGPSAGGPAAAGSAPQNGAPQNGAAASGPAGMGHAPGAGGPGGTVPPQYGAPSGARQPAPRRSRSGMGRRVLSLVLALAVGFGGGVAGSFLMMRLTGSGKVVVQSVQRDTSSATATTTSTDGNDLSLTEVSALATPSVVVITTEQMVTAGNWFGQGEVVSGAGSGVIMSADGYILTCAHVVSGASHITVTIDDKDYDATVVGEDSQSDIAVLKIDATGLTPAVMGDSDALAVGEQVIAVGNPLGELGGTVTNGIVSALNRDVVVEDQEMTLIQTNASVSPGNSGGGLFNMAGELVGIVNAKSDSDDAEGLGFAIPINTAFQVAQDLIDKGYVSGRPAMGVTVITVDSEAAAMQYGVSAYGVYVYGVEEGSPAEKAGLQVGDRILSMDDKEVAQTTDLTGYIAEKAVGDTITLTIARDGQVLTVNVTLGEKTSGQTTQPQTQNQNQ